MWGLLTTDSFEEAVVQVVNLGKDADTAGAVVGALAGAAYGLEAIPARWKAILQGEWPLGSGVRWSAADLVILADRLAAAGSAHPGPLSSRSRAISRLVFRVFSTSFKNAPWLRPSKEGAVGDGSLW